MKKFSIELPAVSLLRLHQRRLSRERLVNNRCRLRGREECSVTDNALHSSAWLWLVAPAEIGLGFERRGYARYALGTRVTQRVLRSNAPIHVVIPLNLEVRGLVNLPCKNRWLGQIRFDDAQCAML